VRHFVRSGKFTVTLAAISLGVAGMHGAEISADSTRGGRVFELQGCVECHALSGIGPTTGPDLTGLADRGFTPASLAAALWNHAPAMWVETRLRNTARPAMDAQQAADLFAFFYSLRFFEEPGDAVNGKALFRERRCSDCHGLTSVNRTGAKPVNQWTVPGDPLGLIEAMWNHSAAMQTEMQRTHIRPPRLTGQEMADLLVYIRSVEGFPRKSGVFQASSPEEGAELFDSKGCAACHGPVTRLSIALRDRTLTDIAADMWNHGLEMTPRTAVFEPGQMRSIAGYIWSRRMTENNGSGRAGAGIFVAKNCGACHDDAAVRAPALTAGNPDFSAATMISVLTLHGPAMLARMQERNIAWPKFSTEEMADLIAYLNARNARNKK
jgi:mono/diheme cytochrome c family protein